MKSPAEIEEILNSKRVSWKNLLTNNMIPCDILVKYFDKIFPRESGTIHTRVNWVAEQYRKNNATVSLELYTKFKNERENFFVAESLADIIDGFADQFEQETKHDYTDNMTATKLLNSWGHGSRKILTCILTSIHQKFGNNAAFLIELANNWCTGKIQLSQDDIDFIRDLVEKTEIRLTNTDLPVIYMLYGLDNIFSSFPLEAIIQSCNSCNRATPIVIPGFCDKLAQQMVATEFSFKTEEQYDRHLFSYFKSEVVPLISDEEIRNTIVELVKPEIEMLVDPNIDWDKLQEKMPKFNRQELTVLFSREDIPVYFLNKNIGYLTFMTISGRDPFPYRH